MERDTHTIAQYCALEQISRSFLYGEWARGEGVEYYYRGAKRMITEAARIRHREKLERLAREEREARNASAGGVASSAASPLPAEVLSDELA